MMNLDWKTKACIAWVLAVVLTAPLPGAGAQESYENAYEVHLKHDYGEAEPQASIVFPITIENYSNEDTEFVFEVEEEDAHGEFHIIPPEPMILPAAAGAGEPTEGTANLVVYTPFENGYVDEDAEITLVIRSHNAQDPTQTGEEKTVTVLAHAEGFYIPSSGALLGGVSIGLAALMLRRP